MLHCSPAVGPALLWFGAEKDTSVHGRCQAVQSQGKAGKSPLQTHLEPHRGCIPTSAACSIQGFSSASLFVGFLYSHLPAAWMVPNPFLTWVPVKKTISFSLLQGCWWSEDLCCGWKHCSTKGEGVHFSLYWAVMGVNISSNYRHIAVQTHNNCSSHFLMNYTWWAAPIPSWTCVVLSGHAETCQLHHHKPQFPLSFLSFKPSNPWV